LEALENLFACKSCCKKACGGCCEPAGCCEAACGGAPAKAEGAAPAPAPATDAAPLPKAPKADDQSASVQRPRSVVQTSRNVLVRN
jgi:hypothetical protein